MHVIKKKKRRRHAVHVSTYEDSEEQAHAPLPRSISSRHAAVSERMLRGNTQQSEGARSRVACEYEDTSMCIIYSSMRI